MSYSTMRRIAGSSILLPLLLALLACQFSIIQATPMSGPAVPTIAAELPAITPDEPDQPPMFTVIVDNSDPDFVIEAGEWGTCWNGDCGGTSYGEDFRYAGPECVSCQAQFTMTAAISGEHDIWAWWPRGEDRAIDTPFTIFTLVSSNQPLVVRVDQCNNGDDWFRLATVPLQEKESAFILVGGSDSGYANADAVAITKQGLKPASLTETKQAAPGNPWGDQPADQNPVIQYFYAETIPDREPCHYLHWDVGNAESIYINEVQVEATGSAEVCPEVPLEYALYAENASGEADQTIAISPEIGNTTVLSTEQKEAVQISAPDDTATSVIFLHHSCGANLIEQGEVRERLTVLGYEFYDHGYNGEGLVLADGTWTGRHFDVPEDNTNPDGFASIFGQPLHDPPDNTFSHLMQYDVIAFKSCYPVSHIASDAQLEDYKQYYLTIRDRIDQYPDKLFVVVTQPPEIPNDTDPDAAARARAFTDWLASDEFLGSRSNIVTFNFFDLLADPETHMLRPDYMTDEYDAHPNESANQITGPIFADFIDRAIQSYKSSD